MIVREEDQVITHIYCHEPSFHDPFPFLSFYFLSFHFLPYLILLHTVR